jgi:1-acyl-sn-glycerol-3-phosphate acyltransferase
MVIRKKYVIIGAPHTSNWDFPLTLLALSALGLQFCWVGKHTLFRGPLRFLFSSIGGIPVDRGTHSSGLVDDMIALFQARSSMILAIAPEGTRSKKSHWKTGFYHIARAAEVPLALGYIDYGKKEIGVGKWFNPTDIPEDDILIIKTFYAGKTGKFPEKQSDIRIRPKALAELTGKGKAEGTGTN